MRSRNCGHVCDPSTQVVFAGLYGLTLNVNVCDKGYFLPYIFVAVAFVYMLIVVVECRQQNAAVAPLQPFVQQELVCKTGRNPKIGRATSQPFQSAVNLQKETHQLFVTGPISSISGQVQGASIIQPLEAWQMGPQDAEITSTNIEPLEAWQMGPQVSSTIVQPLEAWQLAPHAEEVSSSTFQAIEAWQQSPQAAEVFSSSIQPLEAWQLGPQAAEVSSTQYVLSRLILRTGGVTFLAFMFFAVFFITIQHFELICLVPLCMKFGCLLTNVAWYWISAEHHIREATDKKLKLVLSLHGCLYAFYSPEEE